MLRQLRTRRACLEGVTLLLQKPQKHLQVRNGAEALKSITPNPRPRNVIRSRRKPKLCNCRKIRPPEASPEARGGQICVTVAKKAVRGLPRRPFLAEASGETRISFRGSIIFTEASGQTLTSWPPEDSGGRFWATVVGETHALAEASGETPPGSPEAGFLATVSSETHVSTEASGETLTFRLPGPPEADFWRQSRAKCII